MNAGIHQKHKDQAIAYFTAILLVFSSSLLWASNFQNSQSQSIAESMERSAVRIRNVRYEYINTTEQHKITSHGTAFGISMAPKRPALVALACSAPPEGRLRWTLRLLADKLVELEVVDSIGPECVRTTLKKTNLSLG